MFFFISIYCIIALIVALGIAFFSIREIYLEELNSDRKGNFHSMKSEITTMIRWVGFLGLIWPIIFLAYVLDRMNHFLFEKPAEMISNYIIEKSSKEK